MAECRFCTDPNENTFNRRQFTKTLGAAAAATTMGFPFVRAAASVAATQTAGPARNDAAETAVARFHQSLTDEQKKLLAFPFDNPLRSRVQNNWQIVKPRIADLSQEQQAICRDIMKGLCSEDGFERFMYQMDEDYGGFDQYHVAVFGQPGGESPFEWVLTGRHVTLRVDGNSVDGAAFGGPIFYGHASKSFNEDSRHTGNVWWFQGEQANKIFQALDETQRKGALIPKAEPDTAESITLRGAKISETPGLEVSTLDPQQKQMVEKLIEDLLRPFRACDAEEVRACLKATGGLDALRMTYSQEGDIGDDKVWDIWKLEGPAFAWFFRGSPHVHTWLNVAGKV